MYRAIVGTTALPRPHTHNLCVRLASRGDFLLVQMTTRDCLQVESQSEREAQTAVFRPDAVVRMRGSLIFFMTDGRRYAVHPALTLPRRKNAVDTNPQCIHLCRVLKCRRWNVTHFCVADVSFSQGTRRAISGPVGFGARSAFGVHPREPAQPHRFRAFGE